MREILVSGQAVEPLATPRRSDDCPAASQPAKRAPLHYLAWPLARYPKRRFDHRQISRQ